MKFKLTYRGSLRATQARHPTACGPNKHWHLKHVMRESFHTQIKRIWETRQFLLINQSMETPKPYHIDTLAKRLRIPPWRFVPLVTEELSLKTKIEITILRVDHPHLNLWSERAGDVDNRVKTIIDALRVPGANDGYADMHPGPGQDPFFVLVESDELFDVVHAETDHLLVVPPGEDASYAEIVVAVTVRPMTDQTFQNIGFAAD